MFLPCHGGGLERYPLDCSAPSFIAQYRRGALVARSSHWEGRDAPGQGLYWMGCLQRHLRTPDRLDRIPDLRAFEATRPPATVTGRRSYRAA